MFKNLKTEINNKARVPLDNARLCLDNACASLGGASHGIDFLMRQCFMIFALLIVFCLGHSVVQGSLFSSESRERFAQAKAQQKNSAKMPKPQRARL